MEDLKNRINDLANRSYEKNVFVFSQFLNASELAEVSDSKIKFVEIVKSGAVDFAERKMLRFGNENFHGKAEFPISIIMISPISNKFADEITHRDCLGAIMNLGIVREKIGDIFVNGKNAFIIAEKKIAEYIIENLNKIKRNNIKCDIVESVPMSFAPKCELMRLSVSTPRIDSVVAKLFNLSRESSLELFREKKIFLDATVQESNSKLLVENQVVSVRGYGKFRFIGECGVSKKGKKYIELEKFI